MNFTSNYVINYYITKYEKKAVERHDKPKQA